MPFEIRSEAVAGGAAGIVGTILGFPLDSIKTRMQTTHRSMAQSSMQIFKEAGVTGFYRGVASPLLSLTILNTLNFSSFSYFCNVLHARKNEDSLSVKQKLLDWRIPIAASLVGPLSASISTPFEFVKTQMQLNSKLSNVTTSVINANTNNTNSSSSVRMAINLVKQNGLSVLYTGHSVNTSREMVFIATYFTVYENMKLLLTSSNTTKTTDDKTTQILRSTFSTFAIPPTVSIALAGGLSGAMGWLISFPLDLIKSNIQGKPVAISATIANSGTASTINSNARKSAFEIGKELIKTRGFLGLYAGVVPSLLRAFIVSSTRFMVYEGVLDIMHKREKKKL